MNHHHAPNAQNLIILMEEEKKLTQVLARDMSVDTRQPLGNRRREVREEIIHIRTRLKALGIKVYV